MQKLTYVLLFIVGASLVGCNGNTPDAPASGSTDTYALPADVVATAKPLIGGILYSKPDFKSTTLVQFDTSQVIQLLDTSETMFFKARINRNQENYTGYISKAIIPERL